MVFEKPQPGAGKEAADKELDGAGAAEAVHGMLEGCAAKID